MDQPAVFANLTLECLERELGLVRSAIAMVASGASPRVELGGLAYGEQLVEPARRMARQAGVHVAPVWGAGDAGVALRVERLVDA